MKTLTIFDHPGTWIRLAGEDHGLLWRDWLAREAERIGEKRAVEIVTDKKGRMALKLVAKEAGL
jgi:hypothetical protein